MTGPDAVPPLFSVVRGTPTEEELAALVAVLASLPGEPEPAPATTPRSCWADRARAIGAPLDPGPGAWRASARRP